MNKSMTTFLAVAISLTASILNQTPAGAADPMLEKIGLFAANQAGYALYRIPGIVVTSNGTVLAYCEARRTGKSDWDTIDILLRRSTDGGRTWSERASTSAVAPATRAKNPRVMLA